MARSARGRDGLGPAAICSWDGSRTDKLLVIFSGDHSDVRAGVLLLVVVVIVVVVVVLLLLLLLHVYGAWCGCFVRHLALHKLRGGPS